MLSFSANKNRKVSSTAPRADGRDPDRKSVFSTACPGFCTLGHTALSEIWEEEALEEKDCWEKAQAHEKRCCSLTVFRGQDSPLLQWASFLSLVEQMLGRISITLIRSYSWTTAHFGGLGGLGEKNHPSKGHPVNIYCTLGYKDE